MQGQRSKKDKKDKKDKKERKVPDKDQISSQKTSQGHEKTNCLEDEPTMKDKMYLQVLVIMKTSDTYIIYSQQC